MGAVLYSQNEIIIFTQSHLTFSASKISELTYLLPKTRRLALILPKKSYFWTVLKND